MYPTDTKLTLLKRIKAGDEIAWREFYESYKSLVWLKGNDYNLTETEQQELLSDVMLDFFNAQGKFQYNPSKGKFRFYFRRLIAARCIKIIKKRPHTISQIDDIDNIPKPVQDDEYEWKAFLTQMAIDHVKKTMDSRQVQCFLRCKLHNESPAKVAADLEISLASAYNYIDTVMKELKKLVAQLTEQYG